MHRKKKLGLSERISRREFLKGSALMAGGAALAGTPLRGREDQETPPPPPPKAPVVVVTSPGVLDRDQPINVEALREMLRRGLCALSGKDDVGEAWKAFIKPTDSVCVNESGTWLANVPEVVAEVLKGVVQASPQSVRLAYYSHQSQEWIATMREALQARNIPLEVMGEPLVVYGPGGYSSRVPTDPFTALVMIPTLKSHTVAGVSGVIKHFTTICKEGPQPHHPDAMHTAGSVIKPQFGHLRQLFIVDALRFGEIMRGPSYFHKSLVFGTDPVAVDTVALDLFLENCQPHEALDPRFHIQAADKEFHAGTSDPQQIEVRRITV